MPVSKCRIRVFHAVFSLLVLFGTAGFAADQKVLILPFNLYAPPEFAYLEDGILATLSNQFQRFATPIVPTPEMRKALENLRAPYTADTAQTVGASLGATHAVTGSVTIVGDAVTTDIQLWELPQGQALTLFHASGDRPEAVLEHLDQFMVQVAADVFGAVPPPPPVAGQKPSKTTAAEEHPSFPPVTWQSEFIDAHIGGMVIADLSPEIGFEIALIAGNALRIYRREGDSIHLVASMEGAPYLKPIAVDAADLDGDGLSEVLVSTYHLRLGQPRSFVAAWEETEQRFIKRSENLPIYFRTTGSSHPDHKIVGQESGRDDFFGGLPVYLHWRDGQYTIGDSLALPAGTNLYAFVQGVFLPDNETAAFTLSPKKRLGLYTAPDDKRWSSEIRYGGGSVYLDAGETPESQSKQLKQVAEETIPRYYLHPRMLMADLDRDGRQDLLVVRNTDATKGLFRRSRRLTSGRVVCLSWEPLGPVTRWETPKVSGHINDLAIADTDDDGRRELVYAVVAKDKEGLNQQRSYLVCHTLATNPY